MSKKTVAKRKRIKSHPGARTSARVLRAQRREKVIELLAQGLTAQSVADQLEVSQATVYSDLNFKLREMGRNSLEELEYVRAITNARISSRLSAWWKRSDKCPEAMNIVMKLIDMYARYNGLAPATAPTVVAPVTVNDNSVTIRFAEPSDPPEIIQAEEAKIADNAPA